jgi:hypothetical protein
MTDAVFDTTVFIDSHNRLAGAISLMEAASTGRLTGSDPQLDFRDFVSRRTP